MPEHGEQMSWKCLKTHLLNFALSTSVRGIPRAARSEDKVLSVLWTIAVLCCSVILLWTLSGLFSRYYRFDIVTNIKEADYNSVFPNITVCKVNQLNELSTRGFDYSYFISELVAYRNKLPYTSKAVQSIMMPNATEEVYKAFWLHYFSKDGFFPYLPLDVNYAQTTEALNNPFTRYCRASMWDETPSWDCSSAISSVWNPYHYKCSSVKIPDEKRQLIKSLVLVLYLNDFDQPAVKYDCCPDDGSSSSSGIWMTVGEASSATSNGLSIAPGTAATVVLSEVDRKRIGPPYGNCATQEYIGDQSDNIIYSTPACQSLCLQKKRVADCHCIDLRYLYTAELLRSTNNTVCGNETSLNEHLIAKKLTWADGLLAFQIANCLSASSENPPKDCIEACLEPCNERRYDTTVSASGPWPHQSFHYDFYDSYIANTSYSHKFEAYKYIIDAFNNGSISKQEALRQIGSLDLITKNFIQLTVGFSHQKPYIVSDKPAMTFDDFVSAFGGSLSLWLGMTTVFAFEVLELFYLIAQSYLRTKTAVLKTEIQSNLPKKTVTADSNL